MADLSAHGIAGATGKGARSVNLTRSAILLATLLLLSACTAGEVILTGERVELRPNAGAAEVTQAEASRPIKLAAQVTNTEWTHAYGGPNHRIQHLALGPSLTPVWSASIGQGNDRQHRITADPVAADGRIFTIDARALVTATSASGQTLWQRDLTPATDSPDDASGGGLAVVGGRVYAATGFGDLAALDAATGATVWVQRLGAAAAGSPTVVDGLAYIVSRDNRAWAIDIADGRVKWEVEGIPSEAGVAGGAGPAVTDKIAIFPFGSGEMAGVFRKGGLRLWSATLSGQRRGLAYTGISDITADPVVVGETTYAASPSGRLVAIGTTTGERLWTAQVGAYSAVWPEGDSIFLITEQDRLERVDAKTGETIWSKKLPYFTDARLKRRKGVYAHYGPIMAGGRLIVASDDDQIRAFSPVDGSLLATVPLSSGATANPIVVNRTLYIVTANGQLQAFR